MIEQSVDLNRQRTPKHTMSRITGFPVSIQEAVMDPRAARKALFQRRAGCSRTPKPREQARLVTIGEATEGQDRHRTVGDPLTHDPQCG